jgi:ketosteroid isomerase-like protein
MKKLILKTALLSTMVVFSLSAIAQTEAELKQKIEKMNDEMAEAMIAGDYEKNMTFYTDDVVSLPSYDEMMKGKEEIRKSISDMKNSDWKIKDFDFETVSIETNGDIVTEIGKYKMEMRNDKMDQTMKDEGKYLTMWEKQADGSLKIKTEMWNSNKNPMEEMRATMTKEGKNMMGESQEMRDDMRDDMNNDMHENMDKKHMDKKAPVDEIQPGVENK